jgi:phosphinothricin acetyltransferase
LSAVEDIAIRMAAAGDAAAIARIYNHYIVHSFATFETEPVASSDMASRIAETLAVPLPWLVATHAQDVVGYAYAARWKGRSAYRHSVEASVYLDAGHTGSGIGRRLYSALCEVVVGLRMHALIGGIALPNRACVALHERLGFRKVAHFAEVGYKQARWIDVGYWQRLL